MFYTYIYFLFFVFIAWKCWEVILTDLIKITLFTAGTHTLWKLDGNFCLIIKYFFCWSLTDDSELPKPVTRGIAPLKAKRKLFEAPKPHYYYHLEYKLFPTDTEPIKADVVTYGVAAKIYSESDSKVLKTWRDEDKTWVTWTHRLVYFLFIYLFNFFSHHGDLILLPFSNYKHPFSSLNECPTSNVFLLISAPILIITSATLNS